MSYPHPANEIHERLEREERQRRVNAQRERNEWAELQHVYERCVAIAEHLWSEKLEKAAGQQQALAEQMRDRRAELRHQSGTLEGVYPAAIPVPLFTPRDRLQFLKEVSTALLIDAGKRNLTALYKDTNGEAQPAPTQETAPSAVPVGFALKYVERGGTI